MTNDLWEIEVNKINTHVLLSGTGTITNVAGTIADFFFFCYIYIYIYIFFFTKIELSHPACYVIVPSALSTHHYAQAPFMSINIL